MGEGATTFASVVSALDFGVITTNILTVIGASAGFVVGIIAIKKGWSFLKGTIKRA